MDSPILLIFYLQLRGAELVGRPGKFGLWCFWQKVGVRGRTAKRLGIATGPLEDWRRGGAKRGGARGRAG